MKKKDLLLPLVYACLTAAAWCQNGGPDTPVAIVGGQTISDKDLSSHLGAQFQQLRNQEYELKKQALDNLINQTLGEQEASKRATTTDKLLGQEVDSKVAEPTDAEVEAFYLAQRDRYNQPLAEIKPQLSQALKQARIQQARQSYFRSLWAKNSVIVFLGPPKLEVGYDPARIRGNPNAPVTIVEFSDFQCPFCQTASPIMKQLLAKYGDRVKIAYRDFPLRQIHPQSQLAAEASRCAGEQGKFWQYHDSLFEDQSHLDKPSLVKRASSLGLDTVQFESCLESGKFQAAIEKDIQEGTRFEIKGTPAFFINGVTVNGAQPISVFETIVETELARAEKDADLP